MGACLLAWFWWEGMFGRSEGGFGAGGVEPEEFVFGAGFVVVFVAGRAVGGWELAEAAGGGFGGFGLWMTVSIGHLNPRDASRHGQA